MINLDKVIKGVECHRKKVQTTNAVSCLECPYSEPKPIREWCMHGLMDDIYALLKEQEAVTEYVIDVDQPTCKACGFRPFAGYIPSLEWMRERGFKFCPQCGREVKWEE